MAEENQEDNKKVAKDIGDSLSDTLKKAFSNFNKSQDPEWEGIFTRQKTLRKDIGKLEKALTAIQDSIHSAFPKLIESIKSSLTPPPASKPSAGVTTPEVKVSADSPAPKDAPSKDDVPLWIQKLDKGILGLFGMGKKETTKDSTPEVIKESNSKTFPSKPTTLIILS